MVELTIRVIFSLAVVLGLLMLCVRFAGRRFQGGHDALVQVVHRQAIGRHASVSVVNVNGRLLVLGTTDQEVRMLTELDPDSLEVEHVVEHEGDNLLSLVSDRYGADTDLYAESDLVPELESPIRRQQVEVTAARTGRHAAPRRVTRAATAPARPGGLGGSILSPRTWRQAWGAVSGQAS